MQRAMLFALAACSYDPTRASSDDAQPIVDMSVGTDVVMSCPEDYVVATGSRYRFVAAPSGWLAAERDCEDDGFGTHLVVVSAPAELGTIDAVSGASRTWVGASNRSGMWRWVDGNAAPFDDDDKNQCAERYDGTGGGTPSLQNSNCDSAQPYVCECDLMEPVPTN